MKVFLLSEAIFFFMLIVAYVYFRGGNLSEAARSLHLSETAIFTACLVASSFTMWRASANRDMARARLWLGATIAFGVAFLAGQGSEYLRLFHQQITISQSLFGTTFFTLTGFHGLHVIVGIVALAVLFGARKPAAIRTVALYWQFVDLVWIAIFGVVYLGTFV